VRTIATEQYNRERNYFISIFDILCLCYKWGSCNMGLLIGDITLQISLFMCLIGLH